MPHRDVQPGGRGLQLHQGLAERHQQLAEREAGHRRSFGGRREAGGGRRAFGALGRSGVRAFGRSGAGQGGFVGTDKIRGPSLARRTGNGGRDRGVTLFVRADNGERGNLAVRPTEAGRSGE
ncbi:hypothetical protein Kpho01_06490 [Kitasatospora phosalacinea]|uniref:Uncharacterized protein n=1 Tax=Kitasatospora phosalacinea TaxID=2065 RepID=A0A9W6PCW1_9ACTN|nr:hypothetical protein Kpho01_06490 [Kitasatospora phosalacinea]